MFDIALLTPQSIHLHFLGDTSLLHRPLHPDLVIAMTTPSAPLLNIALRLRFECFDDP